MVAHEAAVAAIPTQPGETHSYPARPGFDREHYYTEFLKVTPSQLTERGWEKLEEPPAGRGNYAPPIYTHLAHPHTRAVLERKGKLMLETAHNTGRTLRNGPP